MKFNLKKLLTVILAVVSIILLLWFFISWIEIILHNMTPGYEYSSLNYFSRLLKAFS